MTNSIAPIFKDLDEKQIKNEDMTTTPHRHNKACLCTGKCRVCRCQQKKENSSSE